MAPQKRAHDHEKSREDYRQAREAKLRKLRRTQPPNSNVTTRSQRKASVYHAVFLTTELLEGILAHLPIKDLLLSQRVCSKWRAVITGSKSLQRALFFLPEEPKYGWKFDCKSRKELTRVKLAPENKGMKPKVFYPDIWKPEYKIFRMGLVNPLLFRLPESRLPLDHPVLRAGDRREAHEIFELISWPLPSNPEASWRRMLSMQPPHHCYIPYEVFLGAPVMGRMFTTDGLVEQLVKQIKRTLVEGAKKEASECRPGSDDDSDKVADEVAHPRFSTFHVLMLSEEEMEMQTISNSEIGSPEAAAH